MCSSMCPAIDQAFLLSSSRRTSIHDLIEAKALPHSDSSKCPGIGNKFLFSNECFEASTLTEIFFYVFLYCQVFLLSGSSQPNNQNRKRRNLFGYFDDPDLESKVDRKCPGHLVYLPLIHAPRRYLTIYFNLKKKVLDLS